MTLKDYERALAYTTIPLMRGNFPTKECSFVVYEHPIYVRYDVRIPIPVADHLDTISANNRNLEASISRQRAEFESEIARLSRRIALLEKENEHAWEVAEVLSAQVELLENER